MGLPLMPSSFRDEISRAILLASLQFVDAVVFFSEETPYKLIETLVPDILAKGGDYKVTEILLQINMIACEI